jgi:HCO3- transporter family
MFFLSRLFGGLIQDIKTKAKWYISDFKDGLHIQCVATLFFMFFACLSPIITFGGLLGAATDNYIVCVFNSLNTIIYMVISRLVMCTDVLFIST